MAPLSGVDLVGRSGVGFVGQSGVDFVEELALWGEAPALRTESGTISYRELAGRAAEATARLGATRRLVFLAAERSVETVVRYLACLQGRHPVLFADVGDADRWREAVDRFDPDIVLGFDDSFDGQASGDWVERRPGTRHDLHPDLRLLLSTSGSTGSAKLVRLSAGNLTSNAAAIAQYLALGSDDVAISSLPLGYCYGLSVLHSHLSVGASIVLTDHSVTDPEFWARARSARVTSLAGVPHTFALLDRSRQPWWSLPTLRVVTQAGGRLAPAEVIKVAELGRQFGWRFYVMYGQTEATARMAFLDPTEVFQHPESIGCAIPGGRLRVAAPDADGVGELVYSGPNVMMGYARSAADLARPAELTELNTGDLARHDPDGRFSVVGRRSRFAKLLGMRIDLDRVQDDLTAYDRSVVCVSDDQRLIVATTCADPALLRRRAATSTGLPPGEIAVRRYDEIPRLPNGKPDLVSIAAPPEPTDEQAGGVLAALQRTYGEALGYDRVPPDASFVRLGGDSLSYVEVSLRLEEILGRLPEGWPELSIGELAARAALAEEPVEPDRAGTEIAAHQIGRRRTAFWPAGAASADTSVVLRAFAITLVVAVHLELWGVRGGAHLLLGVAGYTFARFQLSAIRHSDRVIGLGRSIARLAVPCVLFIALVVGVTDGYSLANIALINHYLGPPTWDQTWNFWFVEALVEILVGAALLLSVPAVRRFERRHTVLLPAVLLAVGLLVRYDVAGLAPDTMRYGRTYAIFWLFVLGWLIQRVGSLPQRIAVSLVVLVTLAGYFPAPDDPIRGLVVQAGLLLLLWVPALPMPRRAMPVIRVVAAASLWIYLTHWLVWPFLLERVGLPRGVVAIACVVAGGVVAAGVTRGQRTVTEIAQALTRRLASAEAAGDGGRFSGQKVLVDESN